MSGDVTMDFSLTTVRFARRLSDNFVGHNRRNTPCNSQEHADCLHNMTFLPEVSFKVEERCTSQILLFVPLVLFFCDLLLSITE